MNDDNLYVELISSDDGDTATVIVATADDGAVQSHTFRGMSPDELGALLRDMGATLTRGESSIGDTLTAWAAWTLMHEES